MEDFKLILNFMPATSFKTIGTEADPTFPSEKAVKDVRLLALCLVVVRNGLT